MRMTDNNSRLRPKLARAALGHWRWLAAGVLVACSGAPTGGPTERTGAPSHSWRRRLCGESITPSEAMHQHRHDRSIG